MDTKSDLVYKGGERSRAVDKNRRFCPRAEVRFPIDYHYYEKGRLFHTLQSEIINISAGGMAMLSDRQIQKGRTLLATLQLLPEYLRFDPHQRLKRVWENGSLVMIFSEVVRCELSDTGTYIAGLKFLVLERHHRLRFKQFLNDYRIFKPMCYAEALDEYGET